MVFYIFLASLALASPSYAQTECGGAGQACCTAGSACQGELGCSGGRCKGINEDMVAYANYCKQELGFADPRSKLPSMSCNDSGQVGSDVRAATGRQAQLRLTVRDAAGQRALQLRENGPVIQDGKDVWDMIFGTAKSSPLNCDNPNWLYGRCDPYYRLNVWKPDAANSKIVAVIHCRGTSHEKPEPATAVQQSAKLLAYEAVPSNASMETKDRKFRQWNDSSEIVLIMSNLDSGKTCFFHAASPYYGSYFPAPDDETDVSTAEGRRSTWAMLPVKPPQGASDTSIQREWLRDGRSAWRRPDVMTCTGCHSNGPFMHDAFIDSMNEDGVAYLPSDRKTRPYIPLGAAQRAGNPHFIKTDPVRTSTGTEPQLCTRCHSIGNNRGSGTWASWAVGWAFPDHSSAEARISEELKRYMPPGGSNSREKYYQESGAHIDAIKCCAEHPDWSGCYTVPLETPTARGTPGTGTQSCVASSCGGWNQPCCGGSSCNHEGLSCSSGTCKFVDELR